MILMIFLLIVFSVFTYLYIRNQAVYNFRAQIVKNMYDSGNCSKLQEEYESISYEKMLYSILPLNSKYWYSRHFWDEISQDD